MTAAPTLSEERRRKEGDAMSVRPSVPPVKGDAASDTTDLLDVSTEPSLGSNDQAPTTVSNAERRAPAPSKALTEEALRRFVEWLVNPPRIHIAQPHHAHAKFQPNFAEEIIRAAIAYARRGWRVFPLVPARLDGGGAKFPIIKGWQERATIDEARIIEWWEREFPHANLGIATGPGSNLGVVDLDYKPGKNGPATLAALEALHGPIPVGPRAQRGGSHHIYFQNDPALRSVRGVLPGVDVRAVGGLIVAPPSIHPSGVRYEWATGTDELPLPEMPAWLIAALTPPQKPKPKTTKTNVITHAHLEQSARVPSSGAPSKYRPLIEAIRAKVGVDDVLEAAGLGPVPRPCPLHDGLNGEPADNQRAFSSSDGWHWRCWTRCPDGANWGDAIDLIRRLKSCSFVESLDVAAQLANLDDDESAE
jgi:hypothetical protein